MWIFNNENEISGKSSNKRKNNKEEISKLFLQNLSKKLAFVQIWVGGGGVKTNSYLSKIKMSKIRWGEGGSVLIWQMSLNHLFIFSELTP